MKITLTKDVNLHSAAVYLKMEKEVFRSDIQEYLNGKKFSNDMVERRTPNYLKEIHIFDEQYHLTSYGQRVKETGMIKTWEEGKYEIWFTQNDSFFGNKIFYFKRLPPHSQGVKIEDWTFQIEKENYCLPTDKNGFMRFMLPSNHITGEHIQNTDSFHFEWKWNDLEDSVYAFSGKIAECKIDVNKEIKCSENLKQKISEILPNWDSNTERCKMRLDAIASNVLDSFECPYKGDAENSFSIFIDVLPVEPYNEEEAVQWRNSLLDMKLAEDYVHPKDFESIVASLNQQDGFKAYAQSLSVPQASEYQEYLLPSKKSKTIPAYWHLSAPLDLNPDVPQDAIQQSFTLFQGEIHSFREIIVQKIWRDPLNIVFYYDKYVVDEQQQRKAQALFESFTCDKSYLITNTADNKRSDYLEKNVLHITQKNLKEIFKKSKPQHDRCLILSNGGQLEVWSISNSLDFIRFSGDITADAKGTIEQSVDFKNFNTGKKLHTELLQFVNKEVKQ